MFRHTYYFLLECIIHKSDDEKLRDGDSIWWNTQNHSAVNINTRNENVFQKVQSIQKPWLYINISKFYHKVVKDPIIKYGQR